MHHLPNVWALLLTWLCGTVCVAQVYQVDPLNPPLRNGFGSEFVGLADVNADHRGDFAIAVPYGRVASDPRLGRIAIFSGRTRILHRILVSPQVIEGVFLGAALAELPDVDGDGVSDILVSEVTQMLGGLGYAHVFSGATGTVIHTVTSGRPSAGINYGQSVTSVPDADGDGITDFAVAAPEEPAGGRIYLYSGATGALIRSIVSPLAHSGAFLGLFMQGTPDLSGDGRGDILASANEPRSDKDPTIGVTYLFSGASGEVVMRLPYRGDVAVVLDINADDLPDLLIGHASFDRGRGRLWALSGANGQLLYTLDPTAPPPYPTDFGSPIVPVADLDRDGFGDYWVGAPREDHDGPPEYDGPGAVYLLSGNTGRVLCRYTSPDPRPTGLFGARVASVPDCNNDGLPELLIAAFGEPYFQADDPRVYLFMSCAADWNFNRVLDSQDFFEFLNAFFLSSADFNRDGATTSADFFDFLAAFFAGCGN